MKTAKRLLRYAYRYWIWAASRVFCYLYLRPKFNLEFAEKNFSIPKRPFIMVSNHGTFFDPWLVGHVSRYPISIMMNEEGFKTSRLVQWYLRSVGCYPKKKGESDIRAMKYTMNTLAEGYPILIFPEGQTTWDGETQPIFKGIESIIKRVKLPLVMMRVQGNFLSKPWWSDNYRRGKVIISRKLVTPEEYEPLKKAALRQMIINFIHSNDFENPALEGVSFKGPSAQGTVSRFVWICPACKIEGKLTSNDTEGLICGDCGAAWKMDNRFRFSGQNEEAVEIGHLHDFVKWHKQVIKERIANAGPTDELAVAGGVHYCDVTDLGDYPTIATGSLRLTRERLVFVPDAPDGPKVELAVSDINDYVFQRKDIFECRHAGEVYKFRFEQGSCMRWVFYLRYLNGYDEAEERGFL